MPETCKVYIVDDDRDLREAMLETFEAANIPSRGFSLATDALKEIDPEWAGVVVSDVRMPGLSGLEFLNQVKVRSPDVPFVMMTGHGDVSTAISAMKSGAYDFLEKPMQPDHLISVVKNALELRRLQLENTKLRERIGWGDLKSRIIGRSKAIRMCRKEILAVAPLAVDVLLVGESGTGKELAAQCIHDFSLRQEAAFVSVNCSALTEANFDRELFGGETDYRGRAILAEGGTLFLDGLEALPEDLQLRLLHFAEERTVKYDIDGSVGKIDLRLIASVKSDPQKLVSEGKLRPDIFYQLNVAQITIPPLSKRENDVFVLLEYFLREAASRHNLKLPSVTADDLRPFKRHAWPGNIRELRNAAEKLVIGLPVNFHTTSSDMDLHPTEYDEAMEAFEAELLQNALLKCGGRKSEAAEILGIPRKRLYLRLRHHGIS